MLLLCSTTFGQQNQETHSTYITIPAGKEYKMSQSNKKLWGNNYRKEWTTPVRLPVIMLDTFMGGLKPVKAGGGNQTRSLQLENKEGKRYALRSVNKTLGKVLPKEFLGTFFEDIVNDKVSMSHPYSAVAAAYLADKARVYHTNPFFIYLPDQPALDTFSSFGNSVYLFEEKIDGNWKEADNLGNFEEYTGTFKVLEQMYSDNQFQADQQKYVRSRLFDMLINDWDRHEDQWEWGVDKVNDQTIFRPVPQDRDQAFFSYDGVLLSFLFSASGMKYFQPFNAEMRDVKHFNYEERNLDRFFANHLTLADWQAIATELKARLTDEVIADALKKLPVETHHLSSASLADKLKGRREKLVDYATEYYRFLAKEVDIIGSKTDEMFDINHLNENETSVKIFAAKNGVPNNAPFYNRVFNATETDEIRLYGLSGNDIYRVNGRGDIKVRLIGGDKEDSMTLAGSKVHVYDNNDNLYNTGAKARYHLSDDSSIHDFKFQSYTYDKAGIRKTVFFNNPDRLFVGLGYGGTKHRWRKEPFAYKYNFGVNYSISQGGFSAYYKGFIPHFVGKWDLGIAAGWDAIRWTNFFGLGNESKFTVKDVNYYRARSEEWDGALGLIRKFGHSDLSLTAVYQQVRIINDTSRFTGKTLVSQIPDLFGVRRFGGAQANYRLHSVNDSVVPTRGFVFSGVVSFMQNLEDRNRSTALFWGDLRLYVPLGGKFSVALINGVEAVTGKPEFYQFASIGGARNIRGFRSTRFWGETAFYSSTELRYISDVKKYLYNGKIGLVGFFDVGRIWMKNERSNKIHTAYGGGLILVPFNKVMADVTYAISEDEKLIQLRLVMPIR